ncbi:hypothetical protein KMI8_8 [Klebsiella phage KMI8]|nr:hypothetical protein KMI8_8 [Klebsiella phage KMI8]
MAKPTAIILVNIGLCVIRINKEDYAPEAEFEVQPDFLESQAAKNLFVSRQVEFLDDSKRTKAFIAAIKQKKVKELTKEQLEDGGEIK